MPRDRSRIRPLPFTSSPGNKAVFGKPCYVHGLAGKESTGSAPTSVNIFNGTNASGENILPVNLVAGESFREWYGDEGLYFDQGVFVQTLNGGFGMSIWISLDEGETYANIDFELDGG